MKLFEKRLVGDNFIRGTRSSDMHIFDNSRCHGYALKFPWENTSCVDSVMVEMTTIVNDVETHW
jgi:hypothetical protein